MAATLNELLLTSDDTSFTLTALLTSAVHDPEPEHTLEDIAQILKDNDDLATHLDPLNSLSLLLSLNGPATDDILKLLLDKCSPKEIVIASAENLEVLHRIAVVEGVEEADEDENTVPISVQLLRLIRLFSATSRLPFRKKSPADTLASFLPLLQETLRLTGHVFSRDTGRMATCSVSHLIESILKWAEGKQDVTVQEIEACRTALLPFIETAVDSLAHCVHASLAKRAFQRCFPRLGLREKLDTGWESGKQAVDAAIEAYTALKGPPMNGIPPKSPTTAYFILYAHTNFTSVPSSSLLSFFSIILTSLRTNNLLDETLSILLLTLSLPDLTLDPEIVIPLSTLLPPLASAHPDPFVRHCTFRVLGLLLNAAPEMLRLHILSDLAGDMSDSAGGMRVAVVGLVKDAVLHGLNHDQGSTSTSAGVFASPRFLQVFGPLLFVSSPPDLFTKKTIEDDDLEKLAEVSLPRLSEILGLLYVLRARDVRNRTGIHDKDNRANFERTLLKPMRDALERWFSAAEASQGEAVGDDAGPSSSTHTHSHSHMQNVSLMPLISLRMGLERLDAREM